MKDGKIKVCNCCEHYAYVNKEGICQKCAKVLRELAEGSTKS